MRLAPWAEGAPGQVEFLSTVLDLQGDERILDLACGFGRHSLELARRGHPVVGVDITPDFVDAARDAAEVEGLDAEFMCCDVRDVHFSEEFDVVLNMADGAVGYLEDDAENRKIFEIAARALRPGGRQFLDLINAAYAEKHCPVRSWKAGANGISLLHLRWDSASRRLIHSGRFLEYGLPVERRDGSGRAASYRLYLRRELERILGDVGLRVVRAFGGFDRGTAPSPDRAPLVVHAVKGASAPAT